MDKFDDECRYIIRKYRLNENYVVSREKENFSCAKAVFYGERFEDNGEYGVSKIDYRVSAKYYWTDNEKDRVN